MGKYSDMDRKTRDFYPTPEKAVYYLANHLESNSEIRFIEPFVGDGALIDHIEKLITNAICVYASDIEPQLNGRKAEKLSPPGYIPFNTHSYDDVNVLQNAASSYKANTIISNPPWINTKNGTDTPYQLNHIIQTLSNIAPTWLLLDANYAFNLRASDQMKICTDIIPVGRLIWIPGTEDTGKENCAWFRFDKTSVLPSLEGPRLHPRIKYSK